MANRPPAPVALRRLATLGALAPIVLVESLARGPVWFGLLLAAGALAMAIAWLARRGRGESTPAVSSDLDAAVAATLLLLLLPAGSDWRVACLSVVLAIAIGRQAFGGLGQPLFHPAMVGLALVGLLSPASAQVPVWSAGAAAAAWLGGGALLWRGVIAWRLPVAFFVGASIAILFVAPADVAPALRLLAVAGNPAWVLCAFFVSGDSTTACLHARARWAFGLGAGALVVLFSSWQPGIGLPLAMLLMNFMGPWLDKVLAAPRPQAAAP